MTEKLSDLELKKKDLEDGITKIIDLFMTSCEHIDYSLESMQKYSLLQDTTENKLKVLKASRLMIDHLKSALKDVDYLVNPIENHIMEYTR